MMLWHNNYNNENCSGPIIKIKQLKQCRLQTYYKDSTMKIIANINIKPIKIKLTTIKYVASEFNHDTQHTRKNNQGSEKMFSVYAIQFYCSLDSELLRK